MSKIRAAALGAAVFVGMAMSAGAQTPRADSVRSNDGTVRREQVDGRRRLRMERGMRGAQRRGMKHGAMHRRGMRGGPGARGMRGGMRGGQGGRGIRAGQFGRGMRGGLGANLNLTETQRTRIRAIHEKY